MSDPIKYLTPVQIAKRIGCRKSKVYAWIESGELRAMNSAGPGERTSYRINPEWLEDFERNRAIVIEKVPPQRRVKIAKKGVRQVY